MVRVSTLQRCISEAQPRSCYLEAAGYSNVVARTGYRCGQRSQAGFQESDCWCWPWLRGSLSSSQSTLGLPLRTCFHFCSNSLSIGICAQAG